MPCYVMQYFLYALLTQLSMFLGNVLLLKYMVEIILSGENWMRAVYVMVAYSVYSISGNIYRAYFRECAQKKARERMGALLHKEIYDKAVRVDLADYDNKEKEKSYERKRQYFFHCFYLKDYLKEIQTGA